MQDEEIARLTGKLVFDVNSSPLKAFEQMLKNVSRQMQALGREADAIQQKLNTRFGLNIKSGDSEKLQKSVRASLDRELKGEVALQKARKATFLAELSSLKLTAAGTRENAALQSQATREKIAQAVLGAKAAKADQERLKAQGIELKQAQSLETHKLRQSRLEAILAQQQQRTILLQQKQQANMTAMQRATLALNQARERGLRAAEKYQAGLVAQKARATRQDERARQQDEKHGWAVQRQAVWAARQAEPKASGGFLGLSGPTVAVGGALAGVAAIVGAISALGERLDKRQAGASESQSYSNLFAQIGGKNPANAKRAEEAFAQMTERYGMANTLDTAGDFRVFMLSQQAKGIAMQKSLDTYSTQLAAFRAAGMTRTQQDRAVIQLQQVRSVGKADTEDVRTFAEAAPLIKQSIVEAWGERTKYQGNNLDGAFVKAIPGGGVLPTDFEAGFAKFVSQQQDTLARQMQSIDAQQQRAENARYLQDQSINSNPDLVAAIGRRIAAEQELTASLAPLRKASADLDAAFMSLAAKFLNWTIGKDSTPEQAGKKVDSLSPDAPAIDPATFGGKANSSEPVARDPIDRLFRFLTGTPDYKTEGPAAGLKSPKIYFNGEITPPTPRRFYVETP